MPLCTGVRPWIEDMPCKDGTNDVELYTSNTTGPILSILDRVTAEPEISRDNLENSLMRNGVLTATGRKQLLNAVYGREPDPSDQKDRRTGFTGSKADKDRFFRHHLGNKVLRGWLPGKKLRMGSGLHYENEGDKNAYVYADIEDEDGKETMVLGQRAASDKERTPAWMSQELKRVGSFDPLIPDKRGVWKMSKQPLSGIELRDPADSQYPPGSPRSPMNTGKKELAREPPKTVRIDQMMLDLRIRPSHALVVMKEVLRVVFEVAPFRIDKFDFSLGELVGLGKHGETFNLPHHTDQEQEFTQGLSVLCGKYLDLLLKSQVKEDFKDLPSLVNWKKEYFDLMVRIMQCMPEWQLRAVHTLWTLNRKIMMVRGEVEVKARRSHNPAGFQSHRQSDHLGTAELQLLTCNPEYVQLESTVRENKLDSEWYERLLIMHKRNRQHLCTELELQLENAVLSKRPDDAHHPHEHHHHYHQYHHHDHQHTSTTPAHGIRERNVEESKQSICGMLGPAKGPKAIEVKSPAGTVKEEHKSKPLENITLAELVDSPVYWYDDRLASGDGHAEDKLSLKMKGALKDMIHDTVEINFQRGNKGELCMTSKMLAYKMLTRKRGNMSSNNSLSFVSLVQKKAGVVPGRVADEDNLLGATRGACAFRLVPSFEQHDKKPTHHPTSRPPSAKIRNLAQFHDIQRVLKHPSVDGKGKPLKLQVPIRIHRPPTATPRSLRHRRRAQSAQSSRPHTHHAADPINLPSDGTVSLARRGELYLGEMDEGSDSGRVELLSFPSDVASITDDSSASADTPTRSSISSPQQSYSPEWS